MSIAILKHNAEVLLETARTYEKLIERKKNTNDKNIDLQINKLKAQILYLLKSLNKILQEEKNAGNKR